MKKKMFSMVLAVMAVMYASAMMMKVSLAEFANVQTTNVVQEKPKCSKKNNGKICGGTLELSFTAYKETTEKKCPFCNGTGKCNGKDCTYEHCDNGKIWEWRSAYVCQSCGALYDVSVIQKQF